MGASGKSSIRKVAESYPMNRTCSALVLEATPNIPLNPNASPAALRRPLGAG
jgi:hypothetical protein